MGVGGGEGTQFYYVDGVMRIIFFFKLTCTSTLNLVGKVVFFFLKIA